MHKMIQNQNLSTSIKELITSLLLRLKMSNQAYNKPKFTSFKVENVW